MKDLTEFRNLTVGYTAALPAGQAVKLASRLMTLPSFTFHTDPEIQCPLFQRRITQGVPRANWKRIDDLRRDHPLREVDVGVNLLDPVWSLSKLRKMLCAGAWNSSHLTAEMRLQGKRKAWIGAFGTRRETSRQKLYVMGRGGWTTEQFYEDVLGWFGGAGNILLAPTPHPSLFDFQIRTCIWDGLTVKKVGEKNIKDVTISSFQAASNSLDFDCDTFEGLMHRLDQLGNLPDLEGIGLTRASWRCSPEGWEESRQMINSIGVGMVGLTFLCHGFKVVPPNLAEEMEHYDLIPLGFLGGTGFQGKKIKLPTSLRQICVAVDLMREGNAWALCFTTVESEISRAQRERITEGINSLFPEPILLRDPRQRWGIIPGEKSN